MSTYWKPSKQFTFMPLIFVATTGLVACDSATAPDPSFAEALDATDRQVKEDDLIQEIMKTDTERFRPTSKTPVE